MFHVKHEGWAEAAAAIGVPLQDIAEERLSAYEDLLVARGGPMGLVAPGDLDRIRERHLLDSLRAAALIGTEPVTGYDLGSGGGLPGVVLAIAKPELAVMLVEVRRNRASFLQDVVAALDLTNVEVYPRRLETLRERKDLCFARAFSPLPKAWLASTRLLTHGGRLIYWAGATFDAEEDVPEGVSNALHPSSGLKDAGALVELRLP
jgi:16S rRNA (guanine527-N7)-methyltransferase